MRGCIDLPEEELRLLKRLLDRALIKLEETNDQIIIHVDMDAFYAAVAMRDNPSLRGQPLIIGSLPHERGAVAACSYEARKIISCQRSGLPAEVR